MNKKLTLILMMILIAALVLTGCGGTQNQSDDGNQVSTDSSLKVALLLPGPINDMGWNASAYEGLEQAKEKFDAETAYVENVKQSDMEEVFRGYAGQGYDIVIGHGFQFGDAAKKVAPEFPETKFIVTSSDISQKPNLASVNIDNEQQGFLMGAVAGLLTKSNVVGAIGGQEIPPIVGSLTGYKKGVEYVNPNAQILSTMTGSFDDVPKTKETALAMISQDADVIMANANQAGLGSIEACQEQGILAIGSNQDQNSLAPDTVVVSGIKSVPVLITFVVEKVLDNDLEAKFYNLGFNENAVYLSPWHGFEDKISDEIKAQIETIAQDLAAGKIEYK